MRALLLTVAALTATPALAGETRVAPTLEISYTPDAIRPWGVGAAIDLRSSTYVSKTWEPHAGVSIRVDVFTDGSVQASLEPLFGVAPVPPDYCNFGDPMLFAEVRPGLALRTRGGPGMYLGGAVAGSPGGNFWTALRGGAILPFSKTPRQQPRSRYGRFQDSTLSFGLGPSLGDSSCVVGRPLRHEDHHLLPDASDDVLADVASTWLQRAREEHAAVAAFLRLAAELDAVDAPADLIAATLRAADEEVAHARLCLQRAADLSGQTLHLDEISTCARDLGPRADALRTLLVESWEDGVLNEGAAAAQALDEACSAPDPADRLVQARIAREELGHAALAARIVTWCSEALAA
mgnify:CR=1 FL=1